MKKELLNIANINEWQNHFETAQEYSTPGEEIKPQIGYLSISDSNEKDYEYTVTADSAGLEGF